MRYAAREICGDIEGSCWTRVHKVMDQYRLDGRYEA
jgi:hypothetical protein